MEIHTKKKEKKKAVGLQEGLGSQGFQDVCWAELCSSLVVIMGEIETAATLPVIMDDWSSVT